MKNKLFIVLLLTMFTMLFANNKVNANNLQEVMIGEEFTLIDDDVKLTGIVTINEELIYNTTEDIITTYHGSFIGYATKTIENGDEVKVDIVNNNLIMNLSNAKKFGENKVLIGFTVISDDIIGDNFFSKEFWFYGKFQIKQNSELTNNEKILYKNVTTPVNSHSVVVSTNTKSNRIFCTLDSKTIELDKLDDEDGEPIQISYISYLNELIKNTLTFTNEKGEILAIGDIEFSKNVTNLKYGKRNAYAYVDIKTSGYDMQTIPITITYIPPLEVDYTTRHTAKLVPITSALYSIDGEKWQTSSKFKNLKSNTEYTISVKAKNDTNGNTIQTIKVTTED